MSKKPVAVVLPSWDPSEPRFITMECKECSDDRQFKNGKCVYNQRLGFCYSVDEIVEVLNNEKELNELRTENNQLLAYNSACEDKLLNNEIILRQMINKAEKDYQKLNDMLFPGTMRHSKTITFQNIIYLDGYIKALKEFKEKIYNSNEKEEE